MDETSTPKRIQLVLDANAQETLEALQRRTGATSMTEVLRDALGVYNSLAGIVLDHGGVLCSLDRARQEFQELTIPSLHRGHVVSLGVLMGVRPKQS